MKTIVEIFDECQIENVIAALNFKPEKIIFVGFKKNMKHDAKKSLAHFFKIRNIKSELVFEIVPRYDFEAITQKLENIARQNEDCVFDLTGGREMILTAMGYVAAKVNIPLIQFNVRSGELINVKNSESICTIEKPTICTEESIILNGGKKTVNANPQWNFNSDFTNDIKYMWSVCRKNCGLWNKQCNFFSRLSEITHTYFEINIDKNLLKTYGAEPFLCDEIIKELIDGGLIKKFKNDKDYLSFEYKNEQISRVLSKAGNLLELYGYITAMEINTNEKGYYDDIAIGVSVDWDINNESEFTISAKNEVDLMLMRDLIPIFISCKNGYVHKEDLYELETVAEKFGGKYVKKILLCTFTDTSAISHKYLVKRAEEMGIHIMDNVEKLEHCEFVDLFKKCIK